MRLSVLLASSPLTIKIKQGSPKSCIPSQISSYYSFSIVFRWKMIGIIACWRFQPGCIIMVSFWAILPNQYGPQPILIIVKPESRTFNLTATTATPAPPTIAQGTSCWNDWHIRRTCSVASVTVFGRWPINAPISWKEVLDVFLAPMDCNWYPYTRGGGL